MKHSMFDSEPYGIAGMLATLTLAATGTVHAQDVSSGNVVQLEELTVTGSRLKLSQSEGPAAVTVFDRDIIEKLGATSVGDVLRYLPQQSFSFGDASMSGGTREARLRGLGFGTTLVLINGRRAVASAAGIGYNAFDTNTIPLSAVERVEVLSQSASAIYGADAVGGVVNIILKSDIERPAVDLSYGAADGGADETRASLSLGHSGERFRGTLILDYFERGDLLRGDRDISSDQDFRGQGGTDRRVSTANPGNVCTVSGANLPGLTSACAAVPQGSSGIGLTPADFAATAGQRNLESLSKYIGAVPEAERYSVAASGEYSLTDNVTAFGEFMYSHRYNYLNTGQNALTGLVVPATNPYNPFGTAVRVDYMFEGMGNKFQRATYQSFREVLGLKGRLSSWDWEVSAVNMRDYGWSDDGSGNNVNAAAVNAALAQTDPALALNVFADGPGNSAALLRSLVADTRSLRYDFGSDAVQAGAFARGPLFDLPAGSVQAVIGAEWRSEDVNQVSPGRNVFLTPDDAKRTTKAAYFEARAPLVNDQMGVPLVQQLAVTFAGRADDYSDFGDTFNPQYGLEWRPASSLLLRATYSTSFRAPPLINLYLPPTILSAVVQDPRRNLESVSIPVTYQGNADLQPEEAISSSFGFVFTPSAVPGLHLGGTYWKIAQSDRITIPDRNVLLTYESIFSDRIARAAPTPADVAAGLPGTLLAIDAATMNFGKLDTSGVDLEAQWSFDTGVGQFIPSVTATWVEKYEVVNAPNTAAVDRVGVADTSGTVPRWRAVASLAWQRDALGLSLVSRYISGYADTFSNRRNGLEVDSQVLFDVQGAYSFGKGAGSWADGITVRAGITNLFDTEPEFSEVVGTGYDPTIADIRQRYGYLSLSKAF